MVAKKEVEYHYYSTICPLHSKTNYLLLTQCKFESPSFYPGHFQVLMAPTDQLGRRILIVIMLGWLEKKIRRPVGSSDASWMWSEFAEHLRLDGWTNE